MVTGLNNNIIIDHGPHNTHGTLCDSTAGTCLWPALGNPNAKCSIRMQYPVQLDQTADPEFKMLAPMRVFVFVEELTDL